MAEKTCTPSSQESLILSPETALLLMTDPILNNLMADDDVLNEKKILEEKLEKTSRALAEEVAKSNLLSKKNEEMNGEILSLSERLQNEIKGRQELEMIEIWLKEQLKENEVKIDELQQKLAKKELNEIHIHDDDLNAFGEHPLMEPIEDLVSSQFQADYLTNAVLKSPSSLPATDPWPGEYCFRISFKTQENMRTQWVYSARKNKLYINKDTPCLISFSSNYMSSNDFYIRTTPFFSSADHILDKVHRCVNHSMDEIKKNKPEAEHLVRVESINAIYESDQTGRHSVIVPFENPPAGQQFSSYIFKFACYQSCSGGPNRRPLMLCFTMERRGGIIVGRQKVHLKICACPQRDCKQEEKTLLNSSENQIKKKGVKREREESCDTSQKDISERNYDMPVKVRPGPYCLKVEDRRNYEILKFINKVFLHPSNQQLHRSSLINLIKSMYNSSGSEEEEKK